MAAPLADGPADATWGGRNLGRTSGRRTSGRNLGRTNLGRTNLGRTNLGRTNLGRTIVGRVHNGVSTSPLSLPADKAISVWRSKSTPGGGGYNEILMDDQAGAERLTMHAQRDFKQVVERDAETVIGRNETRTVKGHRNSRTVGNDTGKIDGDLHLDVTGALDVHAKTISVGADDKMTIASGGHMHVECWSNRDDETSANHTIKADALFLQGKSGVQVSAPKVHVFGGTEIHLGVGGSTIHITAGGIDITTAGDIKINGAVVKINC